MGVPLSPQHPWDLPSRTELDSHGDEDPAPAWSKFPTLVPLLWKKTSSQAITLTPGCHQPVVFWRKESCHQQQLPFLLLHSRFSMNLQTFLKFTAPLSSFSVLLFPLPWQTHSTSLPLIFGFLQSFPPEKYSCMLKKQRFEHTTGLYFFLRTENTKLF